MVFHGEHQQKNSAEKQSPLSMLLITWIRLFGRIPHSEKFLFFFQVVRLFLIMLTVFASSTSIPKVVTFSFPQWYYYIMLWLYSHALFSFHPYLLFFLTSNLVFYLPTCLYQLYPRWLQVCHLHVQTGTTSLLTEHSRGILSLTIQKKVPGLRSGREPGGTCTKHMEP